MDPSILFCLSALLERSAAESAGIDSSPGWLLRATHPTQARALQASTSSARCTTRSARSASSSTAATPRSRPRTSCWGSSTLRACQAARLARFRSRCFASHSWQLPFPCVCVCLWMSPALPLFVSLRSVRFGQPFAHDAAQHNNAVDRVPLRMRAAKAQDKANLSI